MLPDSGHFVWEDRAEDYVAAILARAYAVGRGSRRAASQRRLALDASVLLRGLTLGVD
jgi:hypothetical protein